MPGDSTELPHDRVRRAPRRHGSTACRGRTARCRGNLWRSLWPDRPWEAVPIGHVTNGVHLPTWMAGDIQALLDRAPRPALDRAARRQRDVGPGALARPREVLARAPRPQGGAPRLHPRGRAAPLRRPAQGSSRGGGRRDAVRSRRPDDRLRATLRDLQAREPDLQRHRPPAPALHQPRPAGAGDLRRQGAPGRHAGQGSAAERLPLHPRPELRGAHRVRRRLRHAHRPPAGAGRRCAGSTCRACRSRRRARAA